MYSMFKATSSQNVCPWDKNNFHSFFPSIQIFTQTTFSVNNATVFYVNRRICPSLNFYLAPLLLFHTYHNLEYYEIFLYFIMLLLFIMLQVTLCNMKTSIMCILCLVVFCPLMIYCMAHGRGLIFVVTNLLLEKQCCLISL